MRRNFLLAFSLLALPLLLLTVIINAYIVTPLTMRNSLELQHKSLELYRNSIEERLSFFDHISKIVMRDKSLLPLLNKRYTNILEVTIDYIKYYNIYPDTYTALNDNLAAFRFYVNNSSLNKDDVFISELSKLQADESLYSMLLAEPSGKYIRLSDNEISLYRVLNYFKMQEANYPVHEITVRKNELQRAVGGYRPDETIFVTDTENNIMVLSGNAEVAASIAPLLESMTSQTGNIEYDDNIVVYNTTNAGWRIIKLVTPSASFAEALRTRNLINVLTLLSGIVTVLLIIVFSNSFSVRMRLLTEKILDVHRGKYHNLDVIGGSDEISVASQTMDELAAAFSYMIETEYKWKLANTQLRLDLAYARINPHFLYNTLDAIDFYIRRGEAGISTELIRSLAVFYRKSLNLGSDVVSVATELAHLESYLFIEMKMNTAIHVKVEVPESLHDVRINAITLQPLAENSIQHGPDSRNQPLNIHVYGYIDGDRAVLVVKDDGVGFSRQFAHDFNTSSSSMSGIGLSNVHARIRLRFGEPFGLYITEKDTPGAEVRVMLPLRGEYQP